MRYLLGLGALLLLLWCPFIAVADGELQATWLLAQAPPLMVLGEERLAPVVVRNDGAATWDPAEGYALAYHWVDLSGQPVVWDGLRTPLLAPVAPGETLELVATLRSPDEPGEYLLVWDMLQEGVTWFWSPGEVPERARRVSVSPDTLLADVRRLMIWRDVDPVALARMALFWGVTVGHLALTVFWVFRTGSGQSPSSRIFNALLWGLGSLQVALHVTAFSVGLSLGRVAAILVGSHAAVALLVARRGVAGRFAQGVRPIPIAHLVRRQDRARHALRLAGAIVVLAIVLQWSVVSARTLRITGTDAEAYHVPIALQAAQGLTPWGLQSAAPRYPMGHALLAAWAMLPTQNPLIVELANLPVFLLILASLAVLIEQLTDEPGWTWAPWLGLCLFAAPLFSISVPFSADLFYAATFLALFCVLLRAWLNERPSGSDVCLAALATGMLVSAKLTGLVSAGAMLALYGMAVALRAWRLGPPIGDRRQAALALGLFVLLATGAGGIWVVRNWVVIGSPIDPVPLTLFGVQVFRGQAPEARYYRSVLGDLRDVPGYDLWARFWHHTRQWVGAWMIWSSAGALLLIADTVRGLVLTRRVSKRALARWQALGLTVLLLCLHAVMLAGAPFTSLEKYGGVSLRYILPLFILYPALMFACLFSDALPWHGRRLMVGLVGLAMAAGVIWHHAVGRGGVGLGPSEDYFVLRADYAVVSAALVLAGRWSQVPHAAGRWGRAVTMVLLSALLIFLTISHAHDAGVARREAEWAFQQRWQRYTVTGESESPERRLLYMAMSDQGARQADCERLRFYWAGRYMPVLEFQDARYAHLPLYLEPDRTLPISDGDQPGGSGCDYLVVRYGDLEPLLQRVRAQGYLWPSLRPLGHSGDYGLYALEQP